MTQKTVRPVQLSPWEPGLLWKTLYTPPISNQLFTLCLPWALVN